MLFPKELVTPTHLSKIIVYILFILLPIAAFLFGMKYQKSIFPHQIYKIQENNVSTTKLQDKESVKINSSEVLLISGILRKPDIVEWAELDRLPNGIIDKTDPGGYIINVLNIRGEVLYSLPFEVRFGSPDSSRDTNSFPFGFAVPYSPQAQVVEMRHGNNTISKFYITSKILYDAVTALPDMGFYGDSNVVRTELYSQIKEVENFLQQRELEKAKYILQNDLKKIIENSIKNTYKTTSPLEYSKVSILDLLDELIARIG